MADKKENEIANLLQRWAGLAEAQQRAFSALKQEIDIADELIENSTATLSLQFQTMALFIVQQKQQLDDLLAEGNKTEKCEDTKLEQYLEQISSKLEDGEEITAFIKGMVEENQRLKTAVQGVVDSSGETSENISEIITGIQFQDRTKQRLEHIKDSLDVISSMLVELDSDTKSHIDMTEFDASKDELLGQMIDGFNLAEMKDRFIRAAFRGETVEDFDQPSNAKHNDASDDIDLF